MCWLCAIRSRQIEDLGASVAEDANDVGNTSHPSDGKPIASDAPGMLKEGHEDRAAPSRGSGRDWDLEET